MANASNVSGASTVSVASSSSAAAAGGSVIDVSSLVSQLVTATQAPQQAIITQQTQAVSTQISALGALKSALSSFQSSLAPLDSTSSFNTQTAGSTNSAAFTATADSGAPVGSYAVSVTQLASAQQLRSTLVINNPDGTPGNGSTVLSDGSGNAASGTLTLGLGTGGPTFTINVNGGNNTLSGIAAAINSAAGNPGISATVLQGADGPHLLLASTLTGSANTISITAGSGSSSALQALDNSSAANYIQQSAPQDALFSIAGVAASSASNTVTAAMPGITLTLTGLTTTTVHDAATDSDTTTDTPSTLTVITDTSSISSSIQAFVDAYNALNGSFTQLGGYDQTTSTAGPMMGNALLEGMQNSVRSITHGVVNTGSPTYNSLASIGITSNKDGTLSLDQTKLSAALNTNFSAVEQLFSGSSGVATQLNARLDDALSKNGSVAASSTSLVNQENALDDQSDNLQTQMAALSASLTQQFSALNTLLSSLQTTSSYLSQAFASLPTVQGSSSG